MADKKRLPPPPDQQSSIADALTPTYPSLESRRLPIGNAEQGGLIRKLLTHFAKDPSSVLPSPGAITVLPETLPLFTRAMDEAKHVTGEPLVDKAIAFLSTRYPKFASQVPVIARQFNAKGRYVAAGEPYVMINPAKPSIADPSASLGELIETLAHEMTHARQAATKGSEYLSKEQLAGVPYAQREIEQFARRGGATAHDAYMKYLDLLRQQQGPETLGWGSITTSTPRR